MKNKIIPLLLACSPLFAHAHNLTIGQPVPAVNIEQYGELILDQDEIHYQTWHSQDMLGKVRVIQAIAGRSSAKELNAPLIEALVQAKFPEQSYQTTTIVNQDDAIWGTGSFVKSSAQDSKKDFPWSSIVLDEEGNVAATWQLAPESSAIIVQDKEGKILFVQEGKLNAQAIEQVLTLIKQHL